MQLGESRATYWQWPLWMIRRDISISILNGWVKSTVRSNASLFQCEISVLRVWILQVELFNFRGKVKKAFSLLKCNLLFSNRGWIRHQHLSFVYMWDIGSQCSTSCCLETAVGPSFISPSNPFCGAQVQGSISGHETPPTVLLTWKPQDYLALWRNN